MFSFAVSHSFYTQRKIKGGKGQYESFEDESCEVFFCRLLSHAESLSRLNIKMYSLYFIYNLQIAIRIDAKQHFVTLIPTGLKKRKSFHTSTYEGALVIVGNYSSYPLPSKGATS